MPCPIISKLNPQTLRIVMQTLKMNTTTMKHSLANKMITTHHVRHIFTPVNETIKNNLSHTTTC